MARTNGAVVVTGASTGIGEACALALDAAGFQVFAGVRSDQAADSLKSKASPTLAPLRLDVTDEEQIRAAAHRVGEEATGAGLLGLVNNAGIGVGAPIEYVPVEDLRRQLEVNVVGPVAVTQAFLPMLKRSKGRIVNIGSTSGFFTLPLMGSYCASKHAMEAISDALRMELANQGLHVALVQPGTIKTPIFEKARTAANAFLDSGSEEMKAEYQSLMDAVLAFTVEAEKNAPPPDVVAKGVLHALTARFPRARYMMGGNARLERVLSRLPDRLRDRLVLRAMRHMS